MTFWLSESLAEVANVTAAASEPQQDSQLLYTARVQFTPSDSDVWMEVSGPFLWQRSDYARYTGATIEYVLPGRDELGPDMAVYLWRYSMNARILLNGVVVSEAGEMFPPARNLHLPQLARLPVQLLKPRQNILTVELSVTPGYGYLLPPAIGQYEALKSQYDRRYFNQITLHQIIFGLCLFLMLLGLLLWLFDTKSTSYIYFAIASFCWAVYSVNPFIQTIPFSMSAWLWLLHTTIDAFCVAMVMFIHRYFRLTRPLVERVMWAYLALASVGYAVIPAVSFTNTSTLLHLGSFALALYGAGTNLWLGVRSGRQDAYAFLICFVGFLCLGVHDALLTTSNVEVLWRNSFFMLGLGAPLFLLCAGAQLMWQLRRANVHTEWALENAKHRLDQSYVERTQLEKGKAAAEERARIYRDLHDDLGAKLLDLVYQAENEKQANMAREALQEIRSIAAMPHHEPLRLAEWWMQTILTMEERLREAGISLQIDRGALDDLRASSITLTGVQQYHLTKIIRELVTNVVKHADASLVQVTLTLDDELNFQCADNGRGLPQEPDFGTGLTGIRRRVQELDGESGFEEGGEKNAPVLGTRFWMKIPLHDT